MIEGGKEGGRKGEGTRRKGVDNMNRKDETNMKTKSEVLRI